MDPLVTALISVVSTVLVALITLLITLIMGLKKDVDNRDNRLNRKIDEIQSDLNSMVKIADYHTDMKDVELKLDDQGKRILILEIRVKERPHD
jgi:CHASE1-domain containing sensor protein